MALKAKVEGWFQGRIGRLRFSLTVAVLPALYFAAVMSMPFLADTLHLPDALAMLVGGLGIVSILVLAFSTYAKRLHDINGSGWYSLVLFLPLVNLLMTGYLIITPGEPKKNKFGQAPS